MKKIENTTKHQLHILICVNDRTNLPKPKKPDCGPKINLEKIKELKTWIKENSLQNKVKITRTFCLGICSKEGPTILVYPNQQYYTIQDINEIKDLINGKLNLKL